MRYLDVDTRKRISAIGLGTWQFGSREWGYGDAYAGGVADRIVARALELGITLFDSAEAYGWGRSERILGAALRAADADLDESVVVATKILPALPISAVVQQRGLASARRLGVRTIDLYQVHGPNPVVRDGTTMRGMAALQEVGLVEEVGVSNYPLARWQQAQAALGARVLSNQVQYNVVHRDPDDDLVPWAREHRRAVIAWSPLAQGLLSGRYTREHRPRNRVRAANPLFLADSLDAAQPLLDTLREVADAHDATSAQVALAWVLRHPHVAAIPGASSVEQVEHNAAAADLALADDEVAALTASAKAFHPVSGVRAVAGMLRARLPG